MSLDAAIDELQEFLTKPPAYVAIVLDQISRARLLKWWKTEVGPLLSQQYAHHVTVKFNPSMQDVRGMPLGKKATLQVVGWAQNDSVQAVVVKSASPSASKIPHVTVATDGALPSQSNPLLRAGFTRVRGPKLSGTLLGQERTKR
jgi:hypothetical protein